MKDRENAFTIVELMVVIAIIAVLAGLLYGVLGKVIDSSKMTTCMNNMQQISIATKLWGETNKHNSPAGEVSAVCIKAEDADGNTWADLLGKDIGTEIFKCPLQANNSANAYGYGLNPLAGASVASFMARINAGFLLTPEYEKPALLSLIKHPSRTVLFTESGYITDATINNTPDLWQEDGSKPWKPYVAFNFSRPASPINFGYDWGNTFGDSDVGAMGWDEHYRAVKRHEKIITSMADGSVAPLTMDELVTPEWGSENCLYDNQMF